MAFSFSTQAFHAVSGTPRFYHSDFCAYHFCFDSLSPGFYPCSFCFSENGLNSFLASGRFQSGEEYSVSGNIGQAVNIDSKGVYRSFSALSEHKLYSVIGYQGDPIQGDPIQLTLQTSFPYSVLFFTATDSHQGSRLCGKSNFSEFDCSEGQGIINGSFDPTSDPATGANVCTAFGSFVLLPLTNEEVLIAPVGGSCAESKFYPSSRPTRRFTAWNINMANRGKPVADGFLAFVRWECGRISVWEKSITEILPACFWLLAGFLLTVKRAVRNVE